MKKIKVNFVDFWPNFKKEKFYPYVYLSTKYDIEISDNPDYLFCSVFGSEHLNEKYDKTIKIHYSAENTHTNFNFYDYAIGSDYLIYEDRYLNSTLNIISMSKRKMMKSLLNRKIEKRNKFCCMVVSNGDAQERIQFFYKLERYKQVDSGGKFINNIGGPVKDKCEFQKKYKFAICFENSSYIGYHTEKLTEAFYSGCIPIYWGDPKIAEIFNSKSFINIKSQEDFDRAIELVKEIDNNDDLYNKYLSEPIFINDKYLDIKTKELEAFIDNIFSKDKDKAIRCIKTGNIKHYYMKAQTQYNIIKNLLG